MPGRPVRGDTGRVGGEEREGLRPFGVVDQVEEDAAGKLQVRAKRVEERLDRAVVIAHRVLVDRGERLPDRPEPRDGEQLEAERHRCAFQQFLEHVVRSRHRRAVPQVLQVRRQCQAPDERVGEATPVIQRFGQDELVGREAEVKKPIPPAGVEAPEGLLLERERGFVHWRRAFSPFEQDVVGKRNRDELLGVRRLLVHARR